MNIVFDLGGVVFDWNPESIIHRLFQDSETRNLVRAEIFEHPDWIELDRGAISLEQAVVRGVLRTGLPREDIENLFNQVPPSLPPIEETIEYSLPRMFAMVLALVGDSTITNELFTNPLLVF